MTIQEKIEQFLQSPAFGVAGASTNRNKFGNRVLRCYLQHNRTPIPVNPNETVIEGIRSVTNIRELPKDVQSLSIITPPAVTVRLVEEAIAHSIQNIWMQPGAEHPQAIELCRTNAVNLIADGSCLLVVLGYHEH